MTRWLAVLALLVAGGWGLVGSGLLTPPAPAPSEDLVLDRILAADPSGFERATAPRPFDFPTDHGPHPRFRNEWWYFTGNLGSAGGRRFGYQLTIFRTALLPESIERISAWRSEQVFMAHFTLTDVANERFHAHERLSRPALSLAGAQAAPLRVFVERWSIESVGESTWPLRLRADEDEIAIDLTVTPIKPLVLHGESGWSPKTRDGSSASYYYSATRLQTSGSVQIDGETHRVRGSSWLDREWSSGGLAPNQIGWDWFSLQLDDGTDLMWYALRERDGGQPFATGSLVAPDGSRESLDSDELDLEVTDTWRSPRGDALYPAAWRLRFTGRELDLRITPLVADQELNLLVRYWEGAVRVTGTASGKPVTGYGYVELTGYAGQ